MRGWNSGENDHEDGCSDLKPQGTERWPGIYCGTLGTLFLLNSKIEKYQYSFPFLVIFQTVKIKLGISLLYTLSTCFNFLAAGKLLTFNYVFLATIEYCTLYSFYRNLSLTMAMTINTDLLDILKLFFLMQNRKVSRSHSSCKCIRFYNFHTLGPASPQKYRFHHQLSLSCNSEHQYLKKRCPCRL